MSEQKQITTPNDQQVQSSHSPKIGYGQPIAQSTHLLNKIPFLTNHPNVQTSVTQIQWNSANKPDSSVVEQALQRNATAFITKLSDLQDQHKNDNFSSDIQTYHHGKGDKFFIHWKTQVKKIVKLTQYPGVWLARAEAEGIVYRFIKGMQQSLMWET